MDFYNKLNANERLVAIGAVVIVVSWLVAIAGGFGLGANTIALLAAIAVGVIYYLKYSPTSNVNWPAPIQTIVLAVSAIAALLAILSLVQLLGVLGGFAGFFGLSIIAAIGTAIGAGIMAWGAWQEYQAMPKTTNNPPAA